jgi:Ca2+-binding RTX toxin-like protein
VKDPRRTLTLLFALTLAGLPVAVGPAAPAAAATCSLNTTTKVLTASVGGVSGIELDQTHVAVTGCASYGAHAVDTVNVVGTSGLDLFTLDATLPLPVGATAEASGTSEVEVHIDLGAGDDVIAWPSAEATTSLTANTTGFDLNGDGDADVQPVHTETFHLTTGPGNDSFNASAGIPTGMTDVEIEDRQGHDTVTGGPERDTLDPGNGDDTFTGGPGADVVRVKDLGPGSSFDLGSYQGFGGTDTLVFEAPVIADLGSGTAREPAGPVAMSFAGFENVTGLGGADVLIGNDGPNVLEGAAADVLRGAGGDDLLTATGAGVWADYRDAAGVSIDLAVGTATGDGSDTLVGIGNVLGSPGDDTIVGGDDQNVLAGGLGSDALQGADGPDELHGGPGDDLLTGGRGADGLAGGSGEDHVSGGPGTDGWSVVLPSHGVVVDEAATQGARVDLAKGLVTRDGHGDQDTVHSVEKAFGTPLADRLSGSDADNVLVGGGGNDRFAPGPGADHVVGGGGRDTVSYASADRAVEIDLAARTARGQGADVVRDVEVAVGGPRGDALYGSSARERFEGRGGNDAIVGRGGDDALMGGPGADRLVGGNGTDTCNGGAGHADAAKGCETAWRIP